MPVPDRHGRTARAYNDPRRRPSDGFRALTPVRFRKLVDDAISALPERYGSPLKGAMVQIADLPPPPMVDRDGEVLLATFDRRRLTVYRRPVEMRADTRAGLEEVVLVAIAQAVAQALGLDEDDDFLE